MAGARLSKDLIDDTLGAAARNLNVALHRVARLHHDFLQPIADQDLIDMGYSSGEVATLKSAFGDLNLLFEIYQGAQPQAEVKDFRTFAKRIWGFGV